MFPDVAILGGGIIGLACARELRRAGLRVLIIERGGVGQGASLAAAGLLAPLGERHQDARFFAACRGSRDAWPAFADGLHQQTGQDVDLDRSGALVPVAAGGAADFARELVEQARAAGEPVRALTGGEARELLPGLSPELAEVLLFPGEWRVDNTLVLRALRLALRHDGIQVRQQAEVRAIMAAPGGVRLLGPQLDLSAGCVLLAAGAWSARIAGLPPLAVVPVKGEMIGWHRALWPDGPFRGSLRTPAAYVVLRASGEVLVGATEEHVGFDDTTTAEGARRLLAAAAEFLPALASAPPSTHWAGLRPGTLDHRPLLGWLADLPLFVATGHYRNGILLAPWTARIVSEAMVRGRGVALPVEAQGFDPARA